MQLSNADLHLVNTIISTNPSNDDSIIMVLGALGRNSNTTVQKFIVDELLKRLSEAIITTNNTDTLSTLTYALGNSGSKLAIDALLSSLQHDDIDVQISAIRSLGYHLDQPIVQDAFIVSLTLTDEDKVLEEILMILLDAFDSMILTNPSEELLNATVNCTIKLKNPNLYELLIKYLQKIDVGVKAYINLLKQQDNYGEVDRDRISEANGVDSRVKRGSDWDEYNSDYDVVASYSQRRYDVTTYPYHKAYIWGRTYGVDKLNLKVGAGAFIGAYCQLNGDKRFKAFAKAAAKVEVFGKNLNLAHLEYSDYTSNNYLYHKVYVKFGWNVAKSVFTSYYIGSCHNYQNNLWSTGEYKLFDLRFNIFVFVGSVGVYIRGYVSSRGDLNLCACPSKVSACGNVEPSLSLRVSGGAQASLLVSDKDVTTCMHWQITYTYSFLQFLVRGGIEVSATMTYYLRPELCVEGLSGSSCDVHTCLSLYHGMPNNYIDIYAWYQTRNWRVNCNVTCAFI